MGDALVVHEAVLVRRADGILIQILGVELAAFDPCDLGGDQRDTVFKVLRTVRRPDLQLPMVGSQRFQMRRVLIGGDSVEVAGCRMRKRAVKVIFRRFEHPD